VVWDLAFLGDGTMFFTVRAGPVKVRLPDQVVRTLGTPADVRTGSEGGMMGLALDPDFSTNRYLYTCYSATNGTPDNRVVRWTVNAALDGFDASTPIVTGIPYSTGRHSGCRVRFKPGTSELWIGTGDAAIGTTPQDVGSLGGKVLRVDRNGTAWPGNPGLGGDARVYTYGHRNVQGLGFRPGTNQPFSAEHGPGCDDEVNQLVSGGNYGWDPVPGYNEAVPMTDLVAFPAAVVAAWRSGCPTVAPSGMAFLSGAQWEGWDGAIVLALLKWDQTVGQRLRVLFVDAGGNVTSTTDALEVGVRLRSPVQGPDGNLYIGTDAGEIWKVVPS
jgi:glucose/arabinose dehydrogenase